MIKQKKVARCPAGIITVGGRIKMQILYQLLSGKRRFGELQRLLPRVSRQMLTMQLRDLERLKMIQRQVYPQIPPKVEYSLTENGRQMESALQQFHMWSELMGLDHDNDDDRS